MSKPSRQYPSPTDIHPADVYYTVYTTKEQLREYCTRCDEELDVNTPVFRRRLPDLMKKHEGEFVLMRNGKMLGFFQDKEKAYAEGNRRFKDCVYNVMKVHDTIYDLGIRSST